MSATAAAPAAGRLSTKVACITCGVLVRRFTESKFPLCARCRNDAFTVRRQMERSGDLPEHSRFDLTNVYTHPLVLAEVRRLVARRAS